MTSSAVTDIDDFKKRYDDVFGSQESTRKRSKRDPGDAKEAQENEVKSSAATKLADAWIASASELWHSPDGIAFATFVNSAGVRSHMSIQSTEGTEFAQRLFYLKESKAIAQDAVKAALNTVAAQAKYAGDEHAVYSRIAHHDGCVWIDLGDDAWRAIRIDADGWKIVDSRDVPVKFRRTRSTHALPIPQPGGSLDQLFTLFHLEPDDQRLTLGWLVGAFQESGGRALLELIGQQGSGKSTFARMLISLIDPCEIPVRSVSRDEEGLLIAVQGKAVLGYDNVSSLHPDMADAWCRLSTGGGIGKRKLFSDSEETLLRAQLPLVWTAIAPVAINRPDLQDRTITVRLEPLESETYRSERDVNAAFEAMRPQILGALYSAVAEALRNQDTIHLDRLPRLADFATWVEAAAPALGWEAGDFTTALEDSSMRASYMALDASPVGRLVFAYMKDRPHWEGPVSDLLTELRTLASDDDKRQRQFPKDSARLGVQLRRMQRPLADLGVWVGFDRSRRANVVILDRNDDVYGKDADSGGKTPMPPEADPRPQQSHLEAKDQPGDTTVCQWLREQLEHGPQSVADVQDNAKAARIVPNDLNDARAVLKVQTIILEQRRHYTLGGPA